jgi:hypothetical protein
MFHNRHAAAIGLLGLVCCAIGGCGDAGDPPIATLESQVSGILRLQSVALQQGASSIEGHGISNAGVRYRITIKRTSENEPLWFFADDSAGNRIMGPCHESPPEMEIAEVLTAADQKLPRIAEEADGASKFNVILRDGVWDVARESPHNAEGGTALHLDDDSRQAEIYGRFAEVG